MLLLVPLVAVVAVVVRPYDRCHVTYALLLLLLLLQKLDAFYCSMLQKLDEFYCSFESS